MSTPTMKRPDLEANLPSADLMPRKFRPVVFWAWMGAIFACLLVWLLAAWVLSGDFKAVPTGPTPVPAYMVIAARSWETFAVVSAVTIFYRCLVRPWRRERRLTFDGMFCVAAMLSYFTNDLMLNYVRPLFLYNTVFVNRGSWFCHVPGWAAPNGCKMAEPLLGVGLLYPIGLFGFAVIGCAFLRHVKARWPRMGTGGLIAWAFVFSVLCDVVMEIVMVLSGFYVYGGAKKGLTFFYGHYYQFPIYEGVLWGAFWTSLICMRFFKDDKGLSWVERGLDRIKVRSSAKPWVTMLALFGAINVSFLSLYSVPFNFVTLHEDAWPQDIQSRSYMTNGVCGPGTTYACPGPAVPAPLPDSLHLDQSGRVVVPDGTKFPEPVEFRD